MDLVSECALEVAKLTWRNSRGDFTCMVVCKATIDLRTGESSLAPEQEPVVEKDVQAVGSGGDLVLASDLVPLKLRPEVIVVGHAHAPKAQLVPSLLARLIVGDIDKTVQVVGDRYFDREGRLSEPAVFARMPLTWDRAAGGPESANPAGRVIGGAAKPDFFGRIYAPNLLPRGLVLKSRADRMPPVGLGPIAPSWPLRAQNLLQHTGDWAPARWNELPLPTDIDLAFFNAAPLDQQRTATFGEDKIFLEHLHPEITMLATRLPAVSPTAFADLGAGSQPIQLRCDTLVIDADRGRAMLVWRGHVPLEHRDQRGRIVVRGPSLPRRVKASIAPNDTTPYPAPAEVEAAIARFANADTLLSSDAAKTTWVPTSGAQLVTRAALPFVLASAAPEPPEPSHEEDGPPTQRKRALGPATTGPQSVSMTEAPSLVATPIASPAQTAEAEPPRTRRWDIETIANEVPSWLSRTSPLPFATTDPDADAPPMTVANPALILTPPTPFVQPAPTFAEPSPMFAPPAFVEPSPMFPPPAFIEPSPIFAPPAFIEASGAFPPAFVEPSPALLPPVPSLLHAPLAHAPPPLPREPSPLAAALEVVDAPAEALRAEPEIAAPPSISFDAYPPERCGAIAARVGCNEAQRNEILRAEDLDTETWQRVHEHWLEKIREDAARSRKKPLAAYDDAYVRALEAERGPLATADYAHLAEAAERGEAASALRERGLPSGAWPHIHRVWIQRLVKDVRLGKQVRAAIQAARDVG